MQEFCHNGAVPAAVAWPGAGFGWVAAIRRQTGMGRFGGTSQDGTAGGHSHTGPSSLGHVMGEPCARGRRRQCKRQQRKQPPGVRTACAGRGLLLFMRNALDHNEPMTIPTPMPRRLLTVEDYHRMGEAGILSEDERVELIEGELIVMSPIGDDHVWIVNYLNMTLARQVADGAVVSVQNPLTLPPRNEPQPDVVVVSAECARRRKRIGAADALLVIEVADSSLAYDRDTKARIYARFGVREVWIVDVAARRIHVMLDPHDLGYRTAHTLDGNAVLLPTGLPGVRIDFSSAWG